MNGPKWTPGPWSIHDHMGGTHETECEDFTAHTVCIGAGDVLLGEVVAYRMRPDAPADAYKGYPRVRSFEENSANGTLIAAAPDLAEACEAAYAYLAPINNDWPGRHTQKGQRLLCDLRDAIAKATGIDPEAVQDAHSVPAALRKARGEG